MKLEVYDLVQDLYLHKLNRSSFVESGELVIC